MLVYNTEDNKKFIKIKIGGELTFENRDECLKKINEINKPFVVIDLSKVEFIDSSGLSILVSLKKKLREKYGYNAQVYLYKPSKIINQILNISKLEKFFKIIYENNVETKIPQKSIAILDKSKEDRNFLEVIFSLNNFIVHSFENSAALKNFLNKNNIDILLIDIDLPVYLGEELINQIKANKRFNNLNIFIISFIEIPDKLKEKENIYYFKKPVNINNIFNKLTELNLSLI